MGDQSQVSVTRMRGPAILLLGAVALASGQRSAMKEIMEGIDMYNFRARCWGEANVDRQIAALETAKKTCMQVASPLERFGSFARVRPFFSSSKMDHANNILSVLQRGGDISNLGSLWRSKRDTFDFDSINGLGNGNGILNPDEDDILEFLGQFADFKGNVASRMGNLTCVLKQMKMMTPDNKINLEAYTTGLTGESSFSFGMDYNIKGSAVSDPEWRQKYSEGARDCYKLSQNWPQSSLNRNPITRLFGRHMIFFRCADRTERKLCSEAQLFRGLEKLYGSLDPEELAERLDRLGLPDDKYDAAAITVAVMHHAASEEEKFVDRFMWAMNDNHM